VPGEVIPKELITSAPQNPGISPADFIRRQVQRLQYAVTVGVHCSIRTHVHLPEVVVIVGRKIGGRFAGGFRFINNFVFPAAGKNQKRARKQATADSSETEKIGPRSQQRLQRTNIDMSLANRVARKFRRQIP
jgi:hypothetical protein